MTRTAMLKTAMLSVLLLAGCSSGGGGSGTSGVGSGDGTQTTDPVPDTLIEGEWETACALSEYRDAVAEQTVFSVVERVFTLTENTFGDEACRNELWSLATRGSYVEQIPDDGQELSDGLPIDLSVNQVTLTPVLSQVSDQYNATALCGITNWSPEVDMDISDCAEPGELTTATAPRTDYNRFFVNEGAGPDDRSDDVLRLGTLDPSPTEAGRPMRVSDDFRFTRRP